MLKFILIVSGLWCAWNGVGLMWYIGKAVVEGLIRPWSSFEWGVFGWLIFTAIISISMVFIGLMAMAIGFNH